MTPLDRFSFSRKIAEQELVRFKRLLDSHSHSPLRERDHILPFFQHHRHLAALIGTWNSNIARPDRIAFEFDIFGDYKVNLVVGDSENHQYCFVEFEDATAPSIFKKTARATPDWSHRFEHGFSQIIDWILWLDNQRGTAPYTSRFGVSSIQFVAPPGDRTRPIPARGIAPGSDDMAKRASGRGQPEGELRHLRPTVSEPLRASQGFRPLRRWSRADPRNPTRSNREAPARRGVRVRRPTRPAGPRFHSAGPLSLPGTGQRPGPGCTLRDDRITPGFRRCGMIVLPAPGAGEAETVVRVTVRRRVPVTVRRADVRRLIVERPAPKQARDRRHTPPTTAMRRHLRRPERPEGISPG